MSFKVKVKVKVKVKESNGDSFFDLDEVFDGCFEFAFQASKRWRSRVRRVKWEKGEMAQSVGLVLALAFYVVAHGLTIDIAGCNVVYVACLWRVCE